ncbi:aminotransferase-like domain-containing protein [Chitinophaga silvisoli]|uniref:PLP-dependent aminotransferase family protein n=1 Tax=Chitinophaga silvisoli TaxID=2291814 RepID=A0A3E1PAD0_9BACT|nr:PLP-dependent aminotransferase family protein [Chitinophaga silvisoli]RFM37050.1 PLP-dependent aminotransferase family protein [Chitinophaga silvisoli]
MTLRQWKNILYFDLDRKKNLGNQIEEGITREIENGRLRAGMLLPGYRELAAYLGVSRNTIALVYAELGSKGILKSVKRKGTFVAEAMLNKNSLPKKIEHPKGCSFPFNNFTGDIINTEVPPGHWRIKVDDGYPDPKLAPSGRFVATYKQMAFRTTRQKKAEYNSGNSFKQLTSETCRWLQSRRSLNMDDRNLCLIISSRMALYMVAQVLLQKGDIVVVEEPGAAICWQTFQRAGAELFPIIVDNEGIRTDILERELQNKKIKAVYVTPGCQYPTTVTLSKPRRDHLLKLSEQYGFAIIETDNDHEFYYSPTITLPLATKNIEGNVIYIGNLSRMMAPLNLICCVAGPAAFIKSLSLLFYSIYQRADAVLELTVADMMRTDVIGRAARSSQRAYEKKRNNMASYIEKYLRPYVSYNLPDGGLSFWLTFDKKSNIENLRKRLSEQNIWLPPTNLVAYESISPNALRIGYASLSRSEAENTIIAIADYFKK